MLGKIKPTIYALFLILFMGGAQLFAPFCLAKSNPAVIHDVRLWRAPDNTRIVFDLNKAIEHKVFTLENPSRIVIDIPDTNFGANLDSLDYKGSPILSIRSGKQNKTDLRIVLDLSEKVKTRSFFLKKNGKAADRLVIDLKDSIAYKKTAIKTVDAAKKEKRDLIIAIDAGHGGEDPGALGPKGIREKHVVFAIAKELATEFNKHKGYKTILTRKGDYYVGLKKRRDLASKTNADIFISIHADAFRSPKAHGSSIYALSSKGASSASAQFLADKENQADLVGGVSLNDKDALLSSVLVDLSITYKMESSLDIGSKVLKQMDKVSHLHSRRVEQAAFAVLKTLDIPSILIETGFISNPEEARKLNSKSYQRKMAKSIFVGVNNYFTVKAPEDSYIAWKSSRSKKDTTYTVERGDTLSGIANRFEVTMNTLSNHNQLRSSSLRIGQKLKIPVNR